MKAPFIPKGYKTKFESALFFPLNITVKALLKDNFLQSFRAKKEMWRYQLCCNITKLFSLLVSPHKYYQHKTEENPSHVCGLQLGDVLSLLSGFCV